MPTSLKSYPPTWTGELLLACRKCQKKLKGEPGMRALAKLKKIVKRRNKQARGSALHVINVPCMDLCPKGGVTICLPARSSALLILRSEDELDRLNRRD